MISHEANIHSIKFKWDQIHASDSTLFSPELAQTCETM